MANIDAKSCIAGQYALLRRIFSFLSSKDLVVMTQVCKEWRSIASKSFKKTVECYELNDSTVINSRLVPKILLFFRAVDSDSLPDRMRVVERRALIDSWKHKFTNNFMDNASAIFFMTCNSLMCTVANGVVQRPSDDYVGDHVLVIPEIPGVNVELVSVQETRKNKSAFLSISASRTGYGCRHRRVNLKELLSTSKLVVMFSQRRCHPGVSFCLHSLTSPMVGGIPAEFFVDEKNSEELALLSFSGDNVEVYADVLRVPAESDSFFKKLAEEVGPLPARAQRFAFLFACIDLKDGIFKTSSFVKHFPNVPYYGIWSYTELARPSSVVNQSTGYADNRERASTYKRFKADFVYSRCVSVAVVTILND